MYVVQPERPNSDTIKKLSLKVNQQPVKFLVDTGATVDVVDTATYEQLCEGATLHKTHTKIFAYGATKPLPLKGRFQATIESKSRYTVPQIYITEGTGGNLLSAMTAQDLALIKLVHTVTKLG